MKDNEGMRIIIALLMGIFVIAAVVISTLDIKATEANVIDRSIGKTLKWEDTKKAAKYSDYGVGTLMVAPYIYAASKKEDRVKRLSTVAIVQAFNYSLTGYIKRVVKRERPNKENNHSFWSGHSSNAMTGASLICAMNKASCIPAFALAGATGYFRLAAGKHHASDVIVGLGVGYMAGSYVPQLVISF